jgi:hypothetical protein
VKALTNYDNWIGKTAWDAYWAVLAHVLGSSTTPGIGAAHAGQESAPVFKLVCPDGTGGSREVCIKNPFDIAETHKTRIGVKAPSGAAQ